MNSETGHIANPEMMKMLRDADCAEGYKPIPRSLRNEAAALLGNKIEAYLPNTGTALDRLAAKRRDRNRAKRMRRAGVAGY